VPIDDILTPQSPGWWLNRLANRMWWSVYQERLTLLESWYRGEPPLPQGAEAAREAYAATQRLARSNFAGLVVESLRERVIPVGLRTAGPTDDTDDTAEWDVWQDAGLDVISADVHRTALALGVGYVIVGDVDPETKVPTITHEHPRHAITEQDPLVPRRTLAGLKFLHDPIEAQDRLYLYLPGLIYTAFRPCLSDGACVYSFSSQTWSWSVVDEQGTPEAQALPDALAQDVLITEFRNLDGLGEFETHLDLLGRINHVILQRIVIGTMQAFRQRGIKGLPQTYPPGHAKAGQPVDYSQVFVADPGAVWQLPADADMWESTQVDITGVLKAIQDDVQHLSAVTRTPMHVLSPADANQSAEGASLSREGLVFKAEDRINRLSVSWARVLTLANRWLEQSEPVVRPSQLIWVPPERPSLSERAQAAAQAKDVPWRTKMEQIMQFPPELVDRMESERAGDQLLDAAIAFKVAATSSPVLLPTPTDSDPPQPKIPPPPVVLPPAGA
jgi:hypothetical protein